MLKGSTPVKTDVFNDSRHSTDKGPFIFYEGGGAGGIREAPFKNCMTPLSLPIFFTWPPLEAVIFLVDPPPQKKNNIYIYI